MQSKQVSTLFSKIRRLSFGVTVTGFMALSFPQISFAEEIGGFGKGTIINQYDQTRTGLLSAFYFRFTRDDHPLKYIAVHPLINSTIELAFADRDPSSRDDEYQYSVINQSLNNSAILRRSTKMNVCNTFCKLATNDLQLNDSRYVFVLRGFKFTYLRDDFAIKTIRVAKVGGAIDVELHDRSGQNQFAVEVDYALVPRDLVVSTNSITGESRTAVRKLIPAGAAVLSGFALSFLDDDYRIREFGILARQTVNPGPNIEIYFSDNSSSRRFSYQVDYALLE